MPAYRSLNRDRTFTLIYNSSTARVYPVVMANVSLASGVVTPDSLKATLTISGVDRVTRWFYGGMLQDGGAPERIALGFDAAAGLGTGVHVYTLTVTNYYANTPYAAAVNGDLIIVNRSSSPYGSGWAPAGISKLYPTQRNAAVLVVEGDGSAAVYESVAANTWLAPAGAFRDTVRWDGTNYTRRGLDGTILYYNSVGLHKKVMDRIGNEVQYAYQNEADPGSGLSSVTIAPVSANKQYVLAYSASKLSSVTDPASRTLAVTVNGTGDLTNLRDPGFAGDIVIGYDANHRMTSWTSRRNGRSAFRYFEATALRASDTLPEPATTKGFRQFTPHQTRGFGLSPTALNATVAASAATLQIDGLRIDSADVTTFTVNRFGAPSVIADPYSHYTYLRYSSAHPLLADSVRLANGRSLRFTYDTISRVTKSEDLTHSSDSLPVVFYRYKSGSTAPERPDTIILPSSSARRDTITFGSHSNGTLAQISDGRKARTTFRKLATGLDTAVVQHGVPVWTSGSVTVDSVIAYLKYSALGNANSFVTPLGNITSSCTGPSWMRRWSRSLIRARSSPATMRTSARTS